MEIAIAVVLCVGAIATASYIHRGRQRQFLLKPLEVEEPLVQQAVCELGVDSAAVAGVTIFDVLYNTLKLDPYALRGMDRLHHAQEFENLRDLIEFMKTNIITSSPGETAWKQMVNKYKGHTAEEVVAENLTRQGHDVERAPSGVTPGHDLVVDGQPYNVKVSSQATETPSHIQRHLDRHPDVDVITNREMAETFADHPRVRIDPGLSEKDVAESTSATLEGIADIGGLIDTVPLITLAVNAVKNGRKLASGTIDWRTAVEHTALDTTGVGIGGGLGAKAGLALGLVLAPVTGGASAVIIPTATSMLGTVVGVLAGKSVSGWIKGRHLRAAVRRLQSLTQEFRDEFLGLYERVVAAADAFFHDRFLVARQRVLAEHPVKRLLFPSLPVMFYAMSAKELEAERRASRSFYQELRRRVTDATGSEGGMLLYAQGAAVLQNVDPLLNHYRAIREQLRIVEAERRKLEGR